MNIDTLTDVEVMYMTEKFVKKMALKWCKASLKKYDSYPSEGQQSWLIGESKGKTYAITGARRRARQRDHNVSNDNNNAERIFLRERHASADDGTIMDSNLSTQRAFLDIVNQHVPYKLNALYREKNIKEICLEIEHDVRMKKVEQEYRDVFNFTRDELRTMQSAALNVLNEDLKKLIQERLGTTSEVHLKCAEDESCPLLMPHLVDDRTGYELYTAITKYDLEKILTAFPTLTVKSRWSDERHPHIASQRFAIIYGDVSDRAVGMISDDASVRRAVETRNKIDPIQAAEFLRNLDYKYSEWRGRAIQKSCKVEEVA